MIDLGRKDTCCLTAPAPATAEDKPRIDYPRLRITSDKAIEFPEGEFEATIRCKCKSGEWREDERGKKVCTYTIEVMAIEPGEAKEEGESEEGEPEDAASAIMASMKKTAAKKLKED